MFVHYNPDYVDIRRFNFHFLKIIDKPSIKHINALKLLSITED